MNREIEFRGWHSNHKKMYSPAEMGFDGLTLAVNGSGFVNVSGESTDRDQYFTSMIPLQYTGLLDKNNKKIFEGDIVKIDEMFQRDRTIKKHFAPILFEEGGFNVDSNACFDTLAVNPVYWEVVGNIYEHSNLLEENENV